MGNCLVPHSASQRSRHLLLAAAQARLRMRTKGAGPLRNGKLTSESLETVPFRD
jgi:hypothetical protein